MSKERELLQKVLTKLNSYYYEGNVTIKNEIEELLVQPEQNKAEAIMPNGVSVSNVYDAYEEGRKSVMVEQEPVAWIYEWVDEAGEPFKSVVYNFYDGANLIPLYTAPPKREPLSDEAVCQILLKKEWRGFVELVRIIEKAHGIGGGGMSKELLKALTDVLDDLKLRKNLSEDDALNISDSVLMRAENAIKNYLAQPEQEPEPSDTEIITAYQMLVRRKLGLQEKNKVLLAQPESAADPIFSVIEKNRFNEGLRVGHESGNRAILEAAQAKQFYLDENERLTNLLLSAEDKIDELLAQQEPVVWQYRTKPNWQEQWSNWENCRKEAYEDYKRVPLLHDWLYETRPLYISPPPDWEIQ